MKVSAKQYAQSIFELVAGQSETEAAKTVADFAVYLKRQGEINKADAIIVELEKIYAEAGGELTAELASARPLSAVSKDRLSAFLLKRAGAANVKLEEKIEPDLLGGFVLRFNGLVIDGSLKNNLLKFKKQLSN